MAETICVTRWAVARSQDTAGEDRTGMLDHSVDGLVKVDSNGLGGKGWRLFNQDRSFVIALDLAIGGSSRIRLIIILAATPLLHARHCRAHTLRSQTIIQTHVCAKDMWRICFYLNLTVSWITYLT